MPLDTHMFTAEELLPENLNFPVEFEPTKVTDKKYVINGNTGDCLLYTSPSPRDGLLSRMPSSA